MLIHTVVCSSALQGADTLPHKHFCDRSSSGVVSLMGHFLVRHYNFYNVILASSLITKFCILYYFYILIGREEHGRLVRGAKARQRGTCLYFIHCVKSLKPICYEKCIIFWYIKFWCQNIVA